MFMDEEKLRAMSKDEVKRWISERCEILSKRAYKRMLKMPEPCKYHSHIMFISGFYNIFIPYRASWLNYCCDSRFCSLVDSISEGKKCIRS